MTQFFDFLSTYKIVFMFLLVVLLVIALVIVFNTLIVRIRADYTKKHSEENQLTIGNEDFSNLKETEKTRLLREKLSADNVDVAPNGYMIVDDAGQEVYIRSFYVYEMPKNTTFGKTFATLMDFPACTSSIFIEPVSTREISRKLDNHLNTLESEHYAAVDPNRRRKLKGQYRDTENWAIQVESENEKFFRVGLIFSLCALSLEALNRLTADFRNVALGVSVEIVNCYSLQGEAYAANMPFNHELVVADSRVHKLIFSSNITKDPIKMHLMDRKSLSTVFNYTEASFSHKRGIPLGRNIFTRKPFLFDIYDPSHDGFLTVMAGKTGSGKSTTIKVMCERYVLQGYRFVAIDSQPRKGLSEGEYAALAEIVGGVSFQLSNRSQNRLNIYDVQESMIRVKSANGIGDYEMRTLELKDKITLANSDIRTMMSKGKPIQDDALNIYIDRIVSDANLAIYTEREIYDKDPDSLYEFGNVVTDGVLSSGLIPKELPTISDFYRHVLIMQKDNTDNSLNEAYKLIIYGMKDYVSELYYSVESLTFFTREEFQKLPYHPKKKNTRVYLNDNDDYEDVVEIHGICPYYDGQSTVRISRDCSFTNIDISQLTEFDKIVARQIAMGFVNENFIKKNSEIIGASDKLVAIFDEAHENFEYQYGRVVLDSAARTARKRNVGLIICTQTIAEFDVYEETRNILKQSAVKMICKQDAQDAKHLMEKLNLTEPQARLLTSVIGYSDKDDDDEKNKHRGEMCVVDSNKVVFIKVDMIARTEARSSTTSASEIERLYKVG